MNKIALLNDAFRTTLSGGTVLLSAGVHELPDMVKCENRYSTCQTLPEKRAPRSSAPSRRNHRRHGRPLCSAAPSGQASKPLSGAPKARGLTAKVRAEQ